jgi:uncharacterized protein YraI
MRELDGLHGWRYTSSVDLKERERRAELAQRAKIHYQEVGDYPSAFYCVGQYDYWMRKRDLRPFTFTGTRGIHDRDAYTQGYEDAEAADG